MKNPPPKPKGSRAQRRFEIICHIKTVQGEGLRRPNACGLTLRGADGKVQTTWLCVILDDHSRLLVFAACCKNGDTAAFLD